ncbi:MAG: IS630 family transposase [Opitutaceae bacterium]|nr:IS630 family transposase [Opitutaceae bacterium]
MGRGEWRGRKPRRGLAKRIVERRCTRSRRADALEREPAKAQGVHASTVARIWQEHGLQPHRQETFKLLRSTVCSPNCSMWWAFTINPPQNAVVLCVDEKSQIQALDRTQQPAAEARSLRHLDARLRAPWHDHAVCRIERPPARSAATASRATGTSSSLKFLATNRRGICRGGRAHLIVDNYGTHKHERVQRWLARRPRFKLHFIPTSSSWLNLVERWFAELTGKAVRRGSFSSVPDLINLITRSSSNGTVSPRHLFDRWRRDILADRTLSSPARGHPARLHLAKAAQEGRMIYV